MPLPVRDYSWHESVDQVTISIPLKGVKKEKIDILSTDDYVKGGILAWLSRYLDS